MCIVTCCPTALDIIKRVNKFICVHTIFCKAEEKFSEGEKKKWMRRQVSVRVIVMRKEGPLPKINHENTTAYGANSFKHYKMTTNMTLRINERNSWKLLGFASRVSLCAFCFFLAHCRWRLLVRFSFSFAPLPPSQFYRSLLQHFMFRHSMLSSKSPFKFLLQI